MMSSLGVSRIEDEEDFSAINVIVYDNGEMSVTSQDHKQIPSMSPSSSSLAEFSVFSDHTEDTKLHEFETIPSGSLQNSTIEVNINRSFADTSAYRCIVCDKRFATKSSLNRHMKIHKESDKEECKLCKKIVSRIKPHMEIHTKRNYIPCEICGKQFLTANGLKLHLAAHKGTYKYLCSVCGKGFNFSHDLRGHETKHTGVKEHTCNTCKKKFTYLNYFNLHVKTCGKTPKAFVCSTCNIKFKQKRYLQEHSKVHDNPENYQCSACGQCFKYRASLYKHMKTTGHKKD